MRTYRFLFSLISFFCVAVTNYTKAQYINTNITYTAQDLVDKFIGAQNASCITVSNVSATGELFGGTDLSYGYFDKGSSNFEIDEGIILSTGRVSKASGPNNNLQSEFVSGWGGDNDLIDVLQQSGLPTDNILNATSLEFDFVSLQSDKISFDYMFLSEEYRNTNCRYSDAFAFLIKEANTTNPYQNIALVPGTSTPVTSLSINGATLCERNIEYFGGFNGVNTPTNFNGQTKVLKAIANIQKGVKYHIKLVIADHGDSSGLYDSAVFLKSGSFTGNVNIGNDLTLDNADPLCENIPYRIQPTPSINDPLAEYHWFKDGLPLSVPITQSYYDVLNDEGNFSVSIKLGSGCRLQGQVKIEKAPVAIIDTSPIMICDDDFDGKYIEKLSKFTNQIVTNFSGNFKVEYYTQAGIQINPDNNFEFTQNPQDITVKVGAFSCTPDAYTLRFYHGSQLQMNYPQQPAPATIPVFDVCDNELKGSKTVNLDDYIGLMTTETLNPADVKFYEKISELKADKPSISKSQTLSPTQAEKTFYIRISKAGNFCDNYSSFKLRFKQPKKSSILKDTIICKSTTTDLEVEPAFDYYEWSNGEQGTSVNKIKNQKAGDYWVKLTSNGCTYQQFVKISEPQDLVINNALIEGNKVTVFAANGIPPYQYSLDGQPYQTSNVYENVPKGQHIVTVRDACGTAVQSFTIIGVKNVITPNDDGVNDFIDYSDLLTKSDPRFEVYDRYGNLVFKGDVNNQFIWNGKLNSRVLSTSSYWYILEWNETGNPKRVQITGWILLKNRN